jgi:hypothetical protein
MHSFNHRLYCRNLQGVPRREGADDRALIADTIPARRAAGVDPNESSNHQAPNPKEAPIFKFQTPASGVDSMVGIWGLGFIWSLELGIWSFANSSIVNRKSQT